MSYLNFLRSIPTSAEVEGSFPTEEDAYWASFTPEETCSICDGLGHGYPGAGPCPLEERGFGYDDEEHRLLQRMF